MIKSKRKNRLVTSRHLPACCRAASTAVLDALTMRLMGALGCRYDRKFAEAKASLTS